MARTPAKQLIQHKAIPHTEPEDALHFAIATLGKMNYVASWDCSHLVGEQPKRQFSQILQQLGYPVSLLVSPESFLESLKGKI